MHQGAESIIPYPETQDADGAEWNPADVGDAAKARLCVVSRWFGVRSQVWLWRQVRLFSRFSPSVLSWTYENRGDYPLDGIPIRLVGTKEEPNVGAGRWLWRLRGLPSGNLYGSRGMEQRRLMRIVRDMRPSVMLCHFGQVGLRMLPVAERHQIPIVVHFHGVDISSSLRERYYRWSLQRNLSRFSAVICVGSHQRRSLIQLGMPEDRVHLIPCGVPTGEFLPVRHRDREDVTFICVCRLVRWKGVHHSIAAFARIAEKLPRARLVIAGDGGELESLRSLAGRLGVAARVEFTGGQPPARVRELLAASDVFLQHSLTYRNGWCEGFGVSIAEAAASGLPVVVSECGGITEQVLDGVTGLVVPEGDVDAMARAMMTLARQPELRQRLGQAGRERMVEQYDTRSQVRKLEDVLLDALARRRAGGLAPSQSEAIQ